MSDSVSEFCDGIHEELETLQGRMEALKANIGTTWHSLHEKLDEVRHRNEAAKPAVTAARTKLEQWTREKQAEVKGTIDQWIESRNSRQLAVRAQKAENCAEIAIMLARASIDDAERMILEAIAARLDAEAVTVGCANVADQGKNGSGESF